MGVVIFRSLPRVLPTPFGAEHLYHHLRHPLCVSEGEAMRRFGVSVRFPRYLNVSVSNDGSKSSPLFEVQTDTYSFILITSEMMLSCSRQFQYSFSSTVIMRSIICYGICEDLFGKHHVCFRDGLAQLTTTL